MSARVKKFSTLDSVFKLQTFLVLVNAVFMGFEWTGGKNGNKLLSCQCKKDTVDRALKRKKRVLFSY